MYARSVGRLARAAVASPLLTACSGAGFGASSAGASGRAAAGSWAWGMGDAAWLLGAAATASAAILASGSVSAAKPAASAPIFDYGTLDEMHEYPAKYGPLDGYELAKSLRAKHPKDVGIAWRLARAAYNVAEHAATPSGDKKKFMEEAVKLITDAEDLDNNSSDAHRWHGIILSGIGKYQSTKEFIANTYTMRDHWLQAVEINTNDASAYHLLGRWSYDVAEMSWVKRKLASTLFAEPPKASYADALGYFKQAERISPGFWKMNLVMLGKCSLKLNNKEEATAFFEAALKVPIKSTEDREAHAEAVEALKKLVPAK